MSEFDEMDFDEIYENEGDLTPEDIFKTFMLNKNKGTKVDVELKTEDGEPVDFVEIITSLIDYVEEKLEDEEGNQFADQIMPLVSKSIVSVLGRMVGINATSFILANNVTRMGVVYSMAIAFLLLKYVQKHKLQIFTTEEPIDETEMEDIEEKMQQSNIASMATMMGISPQKVLEYLEHMGKNGTSEVDDLIDDDEDD